MCSLDAVILLSMSRWLHIEVKHMSKYAVFVYTRYFFIQIPGSSRYDAVSVFGIRATTVMCKCVYGGKKSKNSIFSLNNIQFRH